MHVDVPSDIFNDLKNVVSNLSFDTTPKAGDYLAGNIVNEFVLNDVLADNDSLHNFLLVVADLYNDYSKIKKKPDALCLDTIWANFQKAGEFNPNHNHSGLMSFVIWIQVPYEIQEVIENSPGANSNRKVAGAFEISYTDILGQIRQYVLQVSRPWEGKMIIFPSELIHCVYPFYNSDEYRISIAGNIRYASDQPIYPRPLDN
jgi:hypothetical protein